MSLPGMRGMEHVGLTVPDLESAIRFFEEVFGCERVIEGLTIDASEPGMAAMLDVLPEARATLSFLRCGCGANLELFEFEAPDQAAPRLRNSDIGAHHLCFYVDDMAQAVAWLRERGVEVMGVPELVREGPSAGTSWVYVLTPWGLQLELISYPQGKAYERAAPRSRLWHPAHPER